MSLQEAILATTPSDVFFKLHTISDDTRVWPDDPCLCPLHTFFTEQYLDEYIVGVHFEEVVVSDFSIRFSRKEHQMSERVTNRMVETAFQRFCRALKANGGDPTDLQLDHAACYGGWRITSGEGSSTSDFGAKRRTNREMEDALDFAADALNVAYRRGRARYDVVGYPQGGRASAPVYTDVSFHDALLLCEKLEAETGYSHYMNERWA